MSDQTSLQAEYDRLSLSLRAMGAGLWDYDLETDELFCSARWYEILGLDSRKTPITSIADFRRHIHPDDVDAATAIDYEKVSGLIANDERYHAEFRIIRPDGEIRWLRSVACLTRDQATNGARAVGCITDITESRADRDGIALPTTQASQAPAADGAERPEPSDSDAQILSERERECLLWVSVGKTAWETAVILGLSRRTIEFHLKNAVRKLGASNKVHATTTAIRNGLL